MTYVYFLEIGLIIFFVRLFSIVTNKFHIPKVLGALAAGVILGPAVLNLVQTSSFISVLSKIAIVFIMFVAGMETRLKSFIAGTRKFLIIAIMGIVVPLLFGILYSRLYTTNFMENLIIGMVITSSSVSITIEALMELKKMKTTVGLAILGAGVCDDILGIIFLTFLVNGSSISFEKMGIIGIRILAFFIVAILVGLFIHKSFKIFEKIAGEENVPIYAVSYALIMAYVAEAFGASGIIGSYIAGLVIGTTDSAKKTKKQVDTLNELLFSPVFFGSIGLSLKSLKFSPYGYLFIVGFAFVIVVSKLIGCGIGARLCGYKKRDAIRIGIGMATRGEVSLIMLETAVTMKYINDEIFSLVLVSILVANILAPILLHLSFEQPKKEEIEAA